MTGDAARLRQIVSNLLSNAIKFTDQGHVRLALAPWPGAPGEVAITVSDTGAGMTGEIRGRLFQPFIQADGASPRSHGGTGLGLAGLGLAISRELARLMGGDVEAQSEPGCGARFHRAPARARLRPAPAAERR